MYGAKVVLNDVGDMYIKARLQQNALEASTWTKEASAPYPPAMRLSHAAMFALGEWTGIGFYGLTLVVAAIFVALSAWYFLQTRWYMFPLLYLNFAYFADRFVYVQDGSYVVMLAFVTVALVLTRRGRGATAPLLMAVATAMKLLPLYYARYVLRMSRRMAWCFAALLVGGLVLPAFVWDGYLDIYRFANERKGNDWLDVAGALLLVVPFTVTLWYVEERLAFAAEDRIGWSLVPFAMFTSLLTNSGRHLLIALIVPDRRAARNIAAAVGLTLHSLLPGLVRLGSVTYVTSAALIIALVLCLRQVGWDLVRDDLRHPLRTLRMLLSARAPAAVHRPAVL
jgi:hypothetical protein